MKISLLGLVAVLGFASASVRGGETFAVDPVHSSVLFGIKHLGVTNFSAVYEDISGTVTFDKEDPSKSSFELTVPVESLDSRNPKRDQHLKSPDFFNVEQFPTLSFKSTKVEANGDVYQVTGDFTLHGVTKSITVEFTRGPDGKNMEGGVIGGGETRFTIKRSDYGMNFMQGALGDEVHIILSIEAGKQ